MEYVTTTQTELRNRLASSRRSAWIRAVVGPVVDEPWRLLALQAIVGPMPAGWCEQTWSYAQCTFVAQRVTGRCLASWCRGGKRKVKLGSIETVIDLPGADQQLQCGHVPSLQQWSQLSMDSPSHVYALHFADRSHINHPQGYFIGADDVPSFPAFAGAYNAFFYGKFVTSGVANPEFGVASIHVIDARAHIRRVRVRPAAIDVWLGGRDLAAIRLELNGQEYRTVVEVDSKHIAVPLPDGLPTDAWLWLKTGSEWLDFRSLTQWGGYISPDVEVEVPRDPTAQLSRLATQGEGQHLEYKEKLPDGRDEKRTVFKTVVAFANGGGGVIVFGIHDKTREVVGLGGDMAAERERLTQFVRDLISPSPRVDIEEGRLDGRDVLVLHVQAGGGTIHALVLDGNKPEYFVRRDGTTFYARPRELEAIAAQNTLGSAAGPAPQIVPRLSPRRPRGRSRPTN
jgi:hypothetical protein